MKLREDLRYLAEDVLETALRCQRWQAVADVGRCLASIEGTTASGSIDIDTKAEVAHHAVLRSVLMTHWKALSAYAKLTQADGPGTQLDAKEVSCTP